MSLNSALLSLFLVVSSALAAIGPVADLHVVNTNIAPDGFPRSAVLAGTRANTGQFPGPVVTGYKGDSFRINVVNHLTDTTMLRSTSIHWHGIFQQKTAFSDGVVGVTQCPIAPNNSFTYTFMDYQQAGTYWYHSHYDTQYCDGLRGAMVVYDRNDPYRSWYDIDNESTIITLADWYHTPAKNQAILFPDATLINGLGRSQPNGTQTPLAVVNVISGLRYRFRLVSLSCDPNYNFSIDRHSMTIIEADGELTKPLVVDSIQIFAGQRYSFILTANEPIGNYWIRANSSSSPVGFAGGVNSAILRYLGAPKRDPTTDQTAPTNPLKETSLHNRVNAPAPGQPQPGGVDFALNINFVLDLNLGQYQVNGAPFVPPKVPVLLQILSGARTPQELLPSGNVVLLPPNAVIELTIPGNGDVGSPHPFHLHGHNFWVVRSAGSSTYNYANPVIRDVVNTGFLGDNTTIRFKTDNAGPWILHCHIDWHLHAGLAIVFAENITSIAASDPPPSWDALCPIFDALDPSQQ